MDALEKKNLATPFQQGSGRGREFVHCGPALPGYRVEVRDENGNALPARHIGRIFAHGPSLMEGYYGNAEESARVLSPDGRSEEHTSELQSLMRISYAVFCLKKKKDKYRKNTIEYQT